MAEKIKKIFKDKKYKFLMSAPTNQVFLIMDNNLIKKLQKKVSFRFWSKYDSKHSVMRFVTSWSTSESDVEKLKEAVVAG